MKEKNIFSAKITSEGIMEIAIRKNYNSNGCSRFFLYENNQLTTELKIMSKSESTSLFVYQVSYAYPIKLGYDYEIYDERNIKFPLDCSYLMRLDEYVDQYYDEGEMGAIYHEDYTDFKVFSPIASEGFVKYKINEEIRIQAMHKNQDTGVFHVRINENLDKVKYYYVLKVNGEYHDVVDPYARSVSLNSCAGVVVNPKQVEVNLHHDCLKPLEKPSDSIIYEFSIRDMTSFNDTQIKNKGKYLGLLEKGIVTKNNNPVGIDYLTSLGITHVQILPMFDFTTTSDTHPEDTYNWGYDPLNYNAPEGSFSSDPGDPYARIIELKQMIAEFHKNGIRVIMDVVYNHVFNKDTSNFDLACPDYYFRFQPNGEISNGSFCGNEFESRHKMARKFIVDSCVYWVKEYGIDGLRFDLMGLIDIDTMNQVAKACKSIKSDFLIYGEGWDMPSILSSNEKSKIYNSAMTPQVGYFNDRFRDIAKGKSSDLELDQRGYLTGDRNYVDGFKHVFLGSTIALAHPPLFEDVAQSINYVECHDNATLFDKLAYSNPSEDIETRLKRIKLINVVTLLSLGIPFIHMGQEIGLSKNNVHNSYNAGDLINQFNYDILDQREEMYRFFKDAIKLKRKYSFLRLENKETICKCIDFVTLGNGALLINIDGKDVSDEFSNIKIFINPSLDSTSYDLDDYYHIIFNEAGLISTPLYAKHLMINGLTCLICVKE